MNPLPEHEIIARFREAMAASGLRTKDTIKPDGQLHRFHVEGDSRGSLNGWAVLFVDAIPAGEFGCWKRGVASTWCARDRSELDPEESRKVQQRIDQARQERERAQREREGAAARLANLTWNDATAIDDDAHPYLQRKGVRSHGLRLARWPIHNADGEVIRHIDDALLVPVMDARGKIISLQAIFPTADKYRGRDKDFLKDGRKRAGFYMIGTPPHAGGIVCIVEGYATGATIHELTGWCVVVAFDAYNLVAVAEAMRAAMPACAFVIAADNDQWTTEPVENPGVTYGKRAAAAIGARLVIPQFADLDGRPTDFNDLAQREGGDVAQAQVMPPPSVPATVPRDVTDYGPTGEVEPIDPDGADTFTPFPDIDGKGKPIATIRNVEEMLRRLAVVVRYNVITKQLEVIIPRASFSPDNQLNDSIACLMSWAKRFRLATEGFVEYLTAIAGTNQFNPVATWITSRPWDGVSRLPAFYATVGETSDTTLPDGGSLKEVMLRKWMLSAVAAAFSPHGVVAKGVLTFQSKQNLGKTSWVKRLVPADLGVVADGLILNPSDRDSVMQCVSNWIVELGEVDATFRKADIAALKAFVSKDRDTLRRPYARAESYFARRTVFFASVNDENFLHDPTGNTRWWTIACDRLDYTHDIDVQQLWAEVLEMFKRGESWHLSKPEVDALNDHNREHESITPIHDMIDKAFEWQSMPTLWTVPMRATEIALRAGMDKPSKADVNAAAAWVVRQYGVTTAKRGKERQKVWLMPAAIRRGGMYDDGDGPL